MTEKLQKQQPKVAVFSVIRRWDHYVPKTIDSVVAQTYGNWEWYIYTSPDSQGDIENYVKDEPRIHLVPNRVFHCHCEDMTKGEKLSNGIVETAQKGDYFCVIDGDDRFTEDFLEVQLSFALENNLDISTAGVMGVDTEGNELSGVGAVEQKDWVFRREDFLAAYPLFMFQYWTLWSRIIKSDLITADLFETLPRIRSINDAPIVFSLLKRAKRIGLTQKIGYYYSVHNVGLSFQNFHSQREEEPFQVNQVLKELLTLLDPQGKNQEKRDYAAGFVLLTSILFTNRALLDSNRSIEDKISLFHKIYTHPDSLNAIRGVDIHQNFLASVQQGDPYLYWNGHFYNRHVISMKRDFASLMKQVRSSRCEDKSSLLETFFTFAPEFRGKISLDGLISLWDEGEFQNAYFNFQEQSPEKQEEQLRKAMEFSLEQKEESLDMAETVGIVGNKLNDPILIEKSLKLRLKWYEKSGMMEEMMAVMDEMIEKNIQFT